MMRKRLADTLGVSGELDPAVLDAMALDTAMRLS